MAKTWYAYELQLERESERGDLDASDVFVQPKIFYNVSDFQSAVEEAFRFYHVGTKVSQAKATSDLPANGFLCKSQLNECT